MTRAPTLLLGLVAGACEGSGPRTGVTEEEFGGEYAAKLCEEWLRCNEDDGACPFSPAGATTSGILEECDYDEEAAEACLGIDWVCGFVTGTVVPAEECDAVCR